MILTGSERGERELNNLDYPVNLPDMNKHNILNINPNQNRGENESRNINTPLLWISPTSYKPKNTK